jgi:hypothetical protein
VHNGFPGALTALPMASGIARTGAVSGRRRVAFTQAQIRRAVRAIEGSGLKVKCVTIAPDGAITIDSDNVQPANKNTTMKPLASWDDAS